MHTESIIFSQDCSGQYRTTEAKCQSNNTRDTKDDGSFKSMFRYRNGLIFRGAQQTHFHIRIPKKIQPQSTHHVTETQDTQTAELWDNRQTITTQVMTLRAQYGFGSHSSQQQFDFKVHHLA